MCCFVGGNHHFVIFYFHLRRPKYWKTNHANSTHVLRTYELPKDTGVLSNNNNIALLQGKMLKLFGYVCEARIGFWRVDEYLANQSIRDLFFFSLRKHFGIIFPVSSFSSLKFWWRIATFNMHSYFHCACVCVREREGGSVWGWSFTIICLPCSCFRISLSFPQSFSLLYFLQITLDLENVVFDIRRTCSVILLRVLTVLAHQVSC